ncbi:Putative secreted protein [Sphingopyxis fribergensis]|uniref:Putative secreted protein n=1 Tax=Sphingopyxis fribergensis TaxID=1515612 RepID=A0A0A7PLZ6_9SPHN|nr:hypothetical protein [Sphingopyxis fribergensis]AJA10208.1 Putative secreted protein [Sphingopyxis fribergensis]
MHKAFALLTVAPSLLAYPAFAQLAPDGSANVDLVGKVGLNGNAVVAAVDGVTNPVAGAVGTTVDDANLTLATREQVRAGAELYDTGGNSIGTVHSVEGDTAVVVRGGKLYNVPIGQIYHGAVGATHGLVTKLSSAEIQARTTAEIESR